MTSKKSIRFFNDRKVRAVWSDAESKLSGKGIQLVSATHEFKIHLLLKTALTDRTNDREMFMKGIDYSYYYEQED